MVDQPVDAQPDESLSDDVESSRNGGGRRRPPRPGRRRRAPTQPSELGALLVIALGLATVALILVQGRFRQPDANQVMEHAPAAPTSSVPTSSVPTSSVPTSSVPTSSVPTSSDNAPDVDRDDAVDAGGRPEDVTINVGPEAIVLEGIVPNQALADELLARANDIYPEELVTDNLTVNDEIESPLLAGVDGELTDPVLFKLLDAGFSGIVGIELSNLNGLALVEPGPLETALGELDALEFESGAAILLPSSVAILDAVADLLDNEPDAVILIGGHTDSSGDDHLNQVWSQIRADQVQKALEARGVTNELLAQGFGEARLAVNPDDTDSKRRINRRIEFRVLS